MFFWVRCLSGRQTSICETTGLTWSNLEKISSRSVLWYIFLMHRLILTLDFTCGVWWRLSSSSVSWAVIGSSLLIAMIQTFILSCAGSWWPDGIFGILLVTFGIVKSSSYNKLKSTFFPEGGNSISYVVIVVSQNGVDVRSSSHGIKLRRYELWITLSGFF